MHTSALKTSAMRTTALIIALLTLLSSLIVIITPINAESGSNPTEGWACGSYTLCKNGGYRPYLEYYTQGTSPTTAGIIRKTFINVYMKAGERIALGSSVHNSTLDINDASGGSDCDIVIVEPNGTKVSENVLQNSDGYIASVAQETAGPNVDGTNTSGFKPIYYTAASDGIYQVRFHSYNGDSTGNPGQKLTTAVWSQSDATVAAWNVTVLNTENKVKSGRIYTKCLALNMGSNSGVALNSNVYVVTSDGFIYNTDFNGMNPFGFVFFANNRGLVSTKTNYSLYQSFASNNNQLSDLVTQGATYQNPWSSDTDMDKTFNIFFESPDPELEGILYPTSYEPETAKNLSFIGSKGDNSSHIGCGGYFKFDITNATSATITIDLSNVLLGDGTYADYGKVQLSNAVTHGTNYFHWDGRGENGVPIPVGIYDNSSIKVSVETFSGEYHFPLFDVEAAPNGIKVTRINTVYREAVDADGNIYKQDVSNKYDDGKSIVFYDNATRESVTAYHNKSNHIADSANAILGVDSTDGAMKFNSLSGSYLGDQTALDIWTHSNNGDPLTISLTTPIVITDDLFTTLSGRIFYDEIFTAGATNNFFALSENDYAIANIEVQLNYTYTDGGGLLHNETASGVTDSYGQYFFAGIPVIDNGNITSCSVTVVKPLASYTLTTENTTTNSSSTTGTETQGVSLGGIDGDGNLLYSPNVFLSDVGYHYEKLSTNIEIKKDWVTDISSDKARPTEVHLTVQSYYIDAPDTRVNVKEYNYVLNNASRWTAYANELPAYEDAAQTRALRYEIIRETYTMRTGGAGYTFQSGDSSDAYPYNTSFSYDDTHSESVILTATNAPKKGSIQLVKRDSEDHGITLSGVEFVLWEKTALTAIPPGEESDYRDASGIIYHKEQTGITNENGIITFSGLDMNSFFVIETAAKVGYSLDGTIYNFTLSGGNQFVNQTIYNTPQVSTLTVVKQIDQVMAGVEVPIKVSYASDAAFTNPVEANYTVNIISGILNYTVCSLTIPSGSYAKISEGSCSYTLNPSQSNVADTTDGVTVKSTYSSDEVFQLSDGHAYTVTLKNNAQYLDTFHVQKLWLDSDGQIMDKDAYTTSDRNRSETAGFSNISYTIERTTDYLNWESVTQRTNGNTIAGIDTTLFGDLREVGASGSGKQLVWTKRFGNTYWHLPKYDNSGNLYTYRISENALSQAGFTQFAGEITYSTVINANGNKETTALFVNPITGATTNYTAAGDFGVYKSDGQQNLILVNYRSSLSYTMRIKKIDGNTNAPLEGAKFTLYSDVGCTTEVSSETTAIDGSGDAIAAFSGLGAGTYYFKETSAPSGYVLPADIKEVVILSDGSVSVDGYSVSVTAGTFSVTVANSLQIIIPQSGTFFSAMFVMLIGMTICIAGLVFVLILKIRGGDSSV